MVEVTLFDLIHGVYRELGQGRRELATGGSTTTVVVDGLKDAGRDSGIMMITKTDDGLAPQGEISKISGYKVNASTFTIATLTAIVESGDSIVYAGTKYPLYNLIDFINDGLQEHIGMIEFRDESITIVDNQRVYDLPTAAKRRLLKVEINNEIDSSNAEKWGLLSNWEIQPSSAGNVGAIVFGEQLAAGHTIGLSYAAFHPELEEFTDVLEEVVPIKAAVLAGTLKALEYNFNKGGGTSSKKVQTINRKSDALDLILRENPVRVETGLHSTTKFVATRK